MIPFIQRELKTPSLVTLIRSLTTQHNMAKLDIEEKFKKDISKEVANLKEFLISQGKEIVKLKQENKVKHHKVHLELF